MMRRKLLAFLGLIPTVSCNRRVVNWNGNGSHESPWSERTAHGAMDKVESSLLYSRLAVASRLQSAFPGTGVCERCRLPWDIVRGHSTMYERGSGCFPLCEDCWSELSPRTRLPYYMSLVDQWESDYVKYRERFPHDPNYAEKREMIKAAVMNEGHGDHGGSFWQGALDGAPPQAGPSTPPVRVAVVPETATFWMVMEAFIILVGALKYIDERGK